MDSPKPADILSRTLSAWRLSPTRNPLFRTEVWQRIEATRRSVPWLAYARRHAGAVAGAVAVAVVLGAIAGRDQARTRVALESTKMASAYVQALDARLMQMP